MGGDRRSEPLEACAADILDWIAEQPGLTLDAIVARLGAQGVACSDRAVARLFKRHGITFKKRTLVNGEAARLKGYSRLYWG